jgi:hypothetical protein
LLPTGSVAISSRKSDFSDNEQWDTLGQVEAAYGNNADSWAGSVYAGVRNRSNRFDFAASIDKGDDYDFNGGTVAATEYDRKQYRLGYGHRFSSVDINLSTRPIRTILAATTALPEVMFR